MVAAAEIIYAPQRRPAGLSPRYELNPASQNAP